MNFISLPAIVVMVLSAGSAALAQRPDRNVDKPIVRSFHWFDYVAAEEIRKFGIVPKVALISHSNFGSHRGESAFKMRDAYYDIKTRAPDLEIDGEHRDAEATVVAGAPPDVLMSDCERKIRPRDIKPKKITPRSMRKICVRAKRW